MLGYCSLIDSVFRAGSLEDIREATAAFTRSIGFSNHGYAMRTAIPMQTAQRDHLYFEDFNNAWSQTYPSLVQSGTEDTDARILMSRRGLPAAAWNIQGDTTYPAPDSSASAIYRRTISLRYAADHDLRSGLTVPLMAPGLHWAFLSFTHDTLMDPREATPVLAHAVYFGHCLQASLDRLLRASTLAISLTPREREVLHWSAAGKTSWEISVILQVSERTVNYHLRQASTRLNVKGRQAACARAVALGLIHP